MAGYGMRDGSAIVNAIGDYAKYKERQEERTYQRERQEGIDAENSRRQAVADDRSGQLFERQMSDYEYKDSERERIAGERTRSKNARQGYVDSMNEGIESGEQKELSSLDRVSQTVGKGSSGEGQGIVANDNGDGSVSFGVLKDKGQSAPLTSDPNDHGSTPLKARKEDLPAVQAHAERSADAAQKSNLDPEDHAAYIRAGFSADKDGFVTPAKHDEFISNLKSQGLLKAMKGKQTSPDEDVPIDAGSGEKTESPSAESVAAAGQITKDLANPIGAVQRKMAENVFDGLEQMYRTGEKGANALINAGKWLSEGAEKRGFGKTVKRTAQSFSMGETAKTTIKKDNVARVIPTKNVETPEGIEDLKDTKETMENMGAPPLKVRPELESVVKKAGDPTSMATEVHNKYDTRRKRASIVGELYVTGNIDIGAMTNFMETGDMRTSRADLERHDLAVEAAAVKNQSAAAKAVGSMYEQKRKYSEMVAKNNANDVKLRGEVTKYLQSEASNIADWYSGIRNLKGPQAKAIQGRVKALATNLIGSETYSIAEMKDPKFGAMFIEGVRSFLQNEGQNGDLSVESVLPYINTAGGKYKPTAAQVIIQSSKSSGRGLKQMRNAYDKQYMQFLNSAHEKGLEWNDERQKLFDSGFQAKYN